MPDSRRRLGDGGDDLLQDGESGVAGISVAEILWGGPRGDGLIFTVARLSASVETLGQTVANLASTVSGSDGLKVRLDLMEVRQADDRRKREDRDRLMLIALWALILPGILFIIGRSIVIAVQGHV